MKLELFGLFAVTDKFLAVLIVTEKLTHNKKTSTDRMQKACRQLQKVCRKYDVRKKDGVQPACMHKP